MQLQQMGKLLKANCDTHHLIDQQIDDWLRKGIINRSDSPYASCPHVVF